MGRIGDGRRGPHWLAFLREFRETFHTTGAILPSSRFLAAEIARRTRPGEPPARTLEVGPGTGPFTDRLIDDLGPTQSLTLVELNERFVAILEQRLATDPKWTAKRARVDLRHGSALELPEGDRYDRIICGLPFNNFAPELVRRFFSMFLERLEPGGTLSFFEYLGIRRAKRLFVGGAERARLVAVGQAIEEVEAAHDVRRTVVWRNLPPAVVHHLAKIS